MMRHILYSVLLLACSLLVPVHDALAGEKVLFVSDRDQPGNYDLYVIDVDTQLVRRLTTDPGIDNHPDLSLDGTKVVWSSTRTKEKPSDPGVTNPEGDFEIFVASWSDTDYLDAPTGTVHQLTSNDVTDTQIPASMRNIADRHPHFSPDGTKIIYTAKYVCVTTTQITCVSECSMPRCITTVDSCGRTCEGIRIMDAQDLDSNHVGDHLINIDHTVLSAANPVAWPPRPPTDARWVGHPSFSHDGTKILFSGAVDGQGREWEIYVGDWSGATVTGLRQVTKGSLYPPNPNPIQMSAGAHFSEDDSHIIFTSTRTALGNSQLFVLPAAADKEPVGPANQWMPSSDRANDYVPEPLMDGRVVLTSDRDEYSGQGTCGGGPTEYTAFLNPSIPHTIRVEASGIKNPSSGGFRIHLDGYRVNGAPMQEETDGTTYSPGWMDKTSPNAGMGHFRVAGGLAGESVSITVPPGTFSLWLALGQTPSSGVARIRVDGVPIMDGNTALPGNPGMSGWDLYTPQFSTGNDLDLVMINPDFTQTDLTNNDFSDEMLLIGDEVSWFCGLSPNLSLCTYLPKSLQMQQLCWMENSQSFLPPEYPKLCLYPVAMQALNAYMSSTNPLRPHNQSYWQQVSQMACSPYYAEMLVVLPTPVDYHIDNLPPATPSNPYPADQAHVGADSVEVSWPPTPDPEGHPVTYDTYHGTGDAAMLIVASDAFTSHTMLRNLSGGTHRWKVVSKDCDGGMAVGPTWTFEVDSPSSIDDGPARTNTLVVSQNGPNPFAVHTSIRFQIPAGSPPGTMTTVRIYNARGQSVRLLVHEALPAGRHETRWDGRDERGRPAPAGLYFYRVQSGSHTDSRTMVLTR